MLWGAYQGRRDYLRQRQEKRVAHQLGRTARALVKRIQRVQSKQDAAWVGINLYRSMKGEIRLAGPVSRPEWAVVFATYRFRKTEIGADA